MTALLNDAEDVALDGMPVPPPPEPVEPDATVDPVAPYGRKADGTPKRAAGRPRKAGATGGRSRSARKMAGGARPPAAAPTAGRTRTPRSATPDYAGALRGALQTVGIPLALNPATMPDAAALAVHGPALCDAVGELAKEHAAVAAVLDRLLAVGPVGVVLGAAVPLFAQVAVNHGVIPLQLGRRLGAMDPAELVAAVQAGTA
jgi:hypothetical protein